MSSVRNAIPIRFMFFTCALSVVFLGCTGSEQRNLSVEKPPKPVAVMLLKSTLPGHRRFVTGSVVPWKSERLGFEVAGRVVEVIEPNEWVTPNPGGVAVDSAAEATVLARLDDEAMRIAVESARTSVEIAKLNRDANLVMVQQQLPAQIESAKAEANLAQVELSRALKLTQQNALARSELDTAQTRVSTANARVASLQAELAYAQARQLALDASTATTVGGLVPLALFGGPLWEGLAWLLIFGLTSATVLTLMVIPVLYPFLPMTSRH